MSAILHGGVWSDVLLQLQQRGGAAALQHGLHHVREDGAQLLRDPVHGLPRHGQHPAPGLLRDGGQPHPGQRGGHLLLHRLDHHPLRHQHQRPHHPVRHPRGVRGQDLRPGLQLSHHAKLIPQCPRLQLLKTIQYLCPHRQFRREFQPS